MTDDEDEVVDAELVDENEERHRGALVRVATHPAVTTTGRQLGGNVLFIAIGGAVLVKRLWESRSTARYERYMRAAEAAGDREALADWETRLAHFRRDRHQRRMELLAFPAKVAVNLPKVLLGLLVVELVIGAALAISFRSLHEIASPILVTAAFVRLVILVFAIAWGPLVLGLPWLGVAALWWVGRAHAAASNTGWISRLRPTQETGMIITADGIVAALQHLGMASLNKAFKDGWQPNFPTSPIKDGQGYRAVFELPLGVTPEMVADQRKLLARNLHRSEVEVWPSDAARNGTGTAGCVDLWVADVGVLNKPAPEYPLLNSGSADVFEGVPAGVSPRGDLILVPVVGNNLVVGGMMGQGKSNAVRVAFLGAALDPLCELWVHVFAGNGDFDAYAPRLARYHRGATDDITAAGLQSLHDLYAEVARRETRLAELGAKKLTRAIARQNPDMRPIFAAFSECHELFGDKEFGEEASELATKTMRRARKTGIVLAFDTQNARKDAIPAKIVENVSVNACFYVKGWRSNDGFLGDGSFAAGIRATELRAGRDRGTSLITGVSDNNFDIIKWFYVEVNDDTGYDAATEVITRSLTKVSPKTRIGDTPTPPAETRDLLDDLAAVLTQRARVADLPARLRKHAPAWTPYKNLSAVELASDLADAGVRTTNTGNVRRLDPSDLADAIQVRSRVSSEAPS